MRLVKLGVLVAFLLERHTLAHVAIDLLDALVEVRGDLLLCHERRNVLGSAPAHGRLNYRFDHLFEFGF